MSISLSTALAARDDVMGFWPQHGACADVKNPDMFFPPQADPDSNPLTAVARQLCAGCPVRLDCLQYALQRPSLAGIWGGTSDKERAAMRRRARREAAEGNDGTVAA